MGFFKRVFCSLERGVGEGLGKGWGGVGGRVGQGLGVSELGRGLGRGWGRVGKGLGKGWLFIHQKPCLKKTHYLVDVSAPKKNI